MSEDKWISIADELPPTSGHYIVWWVNSTSIDYPTICTPVNVLYWGGSQWWAPTTDKHPVTHWMPLPANPKEDGA